MSVQKKETGAEMRQMKDTPKFLNRVAVPGVVLSLIQLILQVFVLRWALYKAFEIRFTPLKRYGMYIHELDPWFNYRATQYLSKNGVHKFFHWYDYKSWYPLGRPVGTTIYPGLQLTSVGIHRVLQWLGPDYEMSLNDVCCTVPCWFGVLTTFFMFLFTWEVTGNRNAAVLAAAVMAVIPGHLMRTVGGGYGNESISIATMVLVFYF